MEQEAGFIELSINSETHSMTDIFLSILLAFIIVCIILYFYSPPNEIILEEV